MTNKNERWETTDKVSDLIKQATEASEYLKEDSVGYYYSWMLITLRRLDSKGDLVVPHESRFKK